MARIWTKYRLRRLRTQLVKLDETHIFSPRC